MRYSKNRAYGLLLTLFGALIIALYVFDLHPVRERAEDYLGKSVKATLASYLVVRGINAGVSVIKESELSLSPAGVGLSLALGEILDPIDDITERVSALLLVSFVSLGVQKLFLEVFSSPLLLMSGTLSILAGLVLLVKDTKPPFLLRVLVLLLILRFLLPAYVAIGDAVYEGMVKSRIEATNVELDRVKSTVVSAFENVESPSDLKKVLLSLKDGADSAVEKMLMLALYFTFQTILLPLISLWIVVKLSLGVIRLKL